MPSRIESPELSVMGSKLRSCQACYRFKMCQCWQLRSEISWIRLKIVRLLNFSFKIEEISIAMLIGQICTRAKPKISSHRSLKTWIITQKDSVKLHNWHHSFCDAFGLILTHDVTYNDAWSGWCQQRGLCPEKMTGTMQLPRRAGRTTQRNQKVTQTSRTRVPSQNWEIFFNKGIFQ